MFLSLDAIKVANVTDYNLKFCMLPVAMVTIKPLHLQGLIMNGGSLQLPIKLFCNKAYQNLYFMVI